MQPDQTPKQSSAGADADPLGRQPHGEATEKTAPALLDLTQAELFALNTPEAWAILQEEGFKRGEEWTTVEILHGHRMTIRKWRLLRRIRAVRGKSTWNKMII